MVIQPAYVAGVSTWRVDDLIKFLGCDGISKSQVSPICRDLDQVVVRPAQDNRRFLNAVFWVMPTGAPPYQVRGRLWQDLPPDYGPPKAEKNTRRRYPRWRDSGAWAELLEAVRRPRL